MPAYNLPFFGEIDSTEPEEYYEANIELNGHTIQLDLNFDEDEPIDTNHLDALAKLLTSLAEVDRENQVYIEKDFNGAGDTVKTYIDHHLENIDEGELKELIDTGNEAISPQDQMLKALRLVRVGFYPGNEQDFAVFDYSINPELTQYLVVIFRNEEGEINYITMES